jgi:hypothetical protein
MGNTRLPIGAYINTKKRRGGRMFKSHLLSGCLLVLAMLLAGCESSNNEPGKVNGWWSGQATPAASDRAPGQSMGAENNPVMTVVNDAQEVPHAPLVTVVPQSPLSNPTNQEKKSNVTDWPVYQDTVYHYQIAYPSQFEFRLLESAELVKSKPEPVTGTYFNDPSTNLGGMVPPRFSIRIFEIGAGTSVEAWLKTNGLYRPEDGWTIQKYQGEHFSGYQVNSALLMAPGMFIYAAQGKYLYQLTPLGQDAEQMLTTFEFTP